MEQEDGDDLSSPFWLPTSRTHRRSGRIRHSLSSLFFSSGLLIILLLLTAIFFLLFIVPSTLSFSAPIFTPNSVKKSWDYLNLILVLFALLFGFLSRNKNEDGIPNTEFPASPITRNEYPTREVSKPNLPSSPQKWYDFADQNQMDYNYSSSVSSRGGGFLKTSSSYPDLRGVSSQVEFTDDPWRFSDDLNWATGSGQLLRRRSWGNVSDDAVVNKINRIPQVHINAVTSSPVTPPPPALLSSPPSPPPLPTPEPAFPEEKPMESRKSRNLGRKRGRNKWKDTEIENLEPISPPAAPPPPPPPPPLPQFVDPKGSKRHKKRSGGSATKDFFHSLYHKKKKKQRQKSVENFDSLFHQNQLNESPLPPPENIPSSKKSTRKRRDAVVSAASTSSAVISSKPKASQFLTVAMRPPPKSVKVSNFYTAENNTSSGGESPIVNIPPPPPPPPRFSKSLAWKFVVQGDYVRVDSMSSSRSGSPELDDTESDATPTAGDVTPAKMSSFCPSPDVNTKADNFISSFRAGLKLEKVNSMKNKHGLGLSNLGPTSNPNKR